MKFFEIIPPKTHFDFVGKFKYAIPLSFILVSSVIFGLWKKGLNFGVDFTGGTVLQVKFPQAKTAEDVRKLVTDYGAPDATVVSMDKQGMEYLITSRVAQDVKGVSELQKKMETEFGKGVIQQSDVVGPRVGSELKWAAIQSLFYSLLFIMVYIWFRFDFRFAPGATIALIHDLTMALGFYIFSGREFNITAIAALLTMAGYGVNDTIVIYDHVRDLFKHKNEGKPLPQIINEAVNMTLSRTVVTSTLVFLSLVPIAIVCEGELEDFAVAMLVGVIFSSYSTFFLAAPLTVVMENWFEKKEKRKNTRPATA